MLVKITKVLTAILVFILILDPGDLVLHLKMPLFAMIWICWITDKIIAKKSIKFNRQIAILIPLFLSVPLFGFLSGLVQDNIEDLDSALGFMKSFLIILLLYIVIDLSIPVHKYLIKACLIIPVIIFPIYFILSFNPSLFQSIGTYMVDQKNLAAFSVRDFYGYSVVMLFYRTSPLLVFPLAYFFNKMLEKRNIYNYLFCGAYFFTLILSGTRANILIAVVIPILMFMFFLLRRGRWIALSAVTILFLYLGVIFLLNISKEKSDESADIKSGHFSSIMNLFYDNPGILVWGQGLGSKYYSIGTKSRIVQSELTYLELIRVFGIPITLLFLFILIYPLIIIYRKEVLFRDYRYSIYAYTSYLFIVGTNPLLISSTGMIAIVVMYALSFCKESSLSQNIYNLDGKNISLHRHL